MKDGQAERHSVTTSGHEGTLEAGRLLGECARPGDVLALSGGLGAGKTVLVKGLAVGLGITSPVPSPTFNLLLVHTGAPTLYHFDLYRLERPAQLEDLDFFETVEEGGGVSAIEWADKFPGELPPDRLEVAIRTEGDGGRVLDICATGRRSAGWAAAWLASLAEKP